MNKNKLAMEIAKDLGKLANSIESFLQVIERECSGGVSGTPVPVETQKSKSITLEEVRAVLAAKSQSGKQVQVKELIKKFGANKLTEIPEEKYLELLKEAEEI